jgi:hypothetical protein
LGSTGTTAKRAFIGPIVDEATLEDPKVFTRPWRISMPLDRHQERNSELLEYECYPDLLEQEWEKGGSPLFEKQ